DVEGRALRRLLGSGLLRPGMLGAKNAWGPIMQGPGMQGGRECRRGECREEECSAQAPTGSQRDASQKLHALLYAGPPWPALARLWPVVGRLSQRTRCSTASRRTSA